MRKFLLSWKLAKELIANFLFFLFLCNCRHFEYFFLIKEKMPAIYRDLFLSKLFVKLMMVISKYFIKRKRKMNTHSKWGACYHFIFKSFSYFLTDNYKECTPLQFIYVFSV